MDFYEAEYIYCYNQVDITESSKTSPPSFPFLQPRSKGSLNAL